MKFVIISLALFVASVLAAIPTPSLPSGIPSLGSLTQTSATPTSSIKVPKCVIDCAATSFVSSGSNCTSLQDTCICNDTKFQDAMNNCLKDCTTSEQLAATAFEKGVCAAVPSTSPSGSGALAFQIEFARSGVFALTIAVGGVIMGGFLI